jgi:hypothetical protein
VIYVDIWNLAGMGRSRAAPLEQGFLTPPTPFGMTNLFFGSVWLCRDKGDEIRRAWFLVLRIGCV